MRLSRWAELVILFGVGPGLLSFGPRWLVLPAILTAGAFCVTVLLRDSGFRRRGLFDLPATRAGLGRVLVRALVVCAALFLLARATGGPAGLFHLPRTRPLVWAAVLFAYPILSAYPQEVMYRTYFFHRFGDLFPGPVTRVVANALLFGWAHLIVHSAAAILLATVGGLLLASTYERSRSTLLVGIEHAIYGDFVFSVGLGGMFVSGVQLLSVIVK